MLKRPHSKSTRFKLRQWKLEGVDVPALSARNHQAMRQRLTERHLVPTNEQSQYGETMLSEAESAFLSYWQQQIMPRFMGIHGTEEWALIEQAGAMVPVADRVRAKTNHHNSHTKGAARQEVLYFVLGIGDSHETPAFLSQYSGQIKLDFSKIPEAQKKYFESMFVGGHLVDYEESRQYRDTQIGDTIISVSYDKTTMSKTTRFCRGDGAEITEVLHFNDEIVSHDGDYQQIFYWLGLKLIEYLRFFGGEFQQQVLSSRDTDATADAFHSLFPSYRFPELKIMTDKLPLQAEFLEVKKYDPRQYQAVYALHSAVTALDVDAAILALESTDVNVVNTEGETPLEVLLNTASNSSSDIENVIAMLDVLLGLQPINLNRCYPCNTLLGINQILPLKIAISSMNVHAVKSLLAHGASPKVAVSKLSEDLFAEVQSTRRACQIMMLSFKRITHTQTEAASPETIRQQLATLDEIEHCLLEAAPELSERARKPDPLAALFTI